MRLTVEGESEGGTDIRGIRTSFLRGFVLIKRSTPLVFVGRRGTGQDDLTSNEGLGDDLVSWTYNPQLRSPGRVRNLTKEPFVLYQGFYSWRVCTE